MLLLVLAAACGRPADAQVAPPERAEPLAEQRRDAGTDAILPRETALPDAGLLSDGGTPMSPIVARPHAVPAR